MDFHLYQNVSNKGEAEKCRDLGKVDQF